MENSAGLDGFTLGLTKDFMLVPFALYFQTGLEYYYQNDANDENVRVPASDLVARVVGDRTEHFLGIPVFFLDLVVPSCAAQRGWGWTERTLSPL